MLKLRNEFCGIKVGDKIGSLTIIGPAFRLREKLTVWFVVTQCDCGVVSVKKIRNIKRGDAISCGCVRRERFAIASRKPRKHGHARREGRSRLNQIWKQMRQRCSNPNDSSFSRYGARGIKICEEWSEYAAFMQWALANGYQDDLSIDRIDGDGDYEPSNCRWATDEEQANNKQTTHRYEYMGQMLTRTELASVAGMKRRTLASRLDHGWSVEDAVERPLRIW